MPLHQKQAGRIREGSRVLEYYQDIYPDLPFASLPCISVMALNSRQFPVCCYTIKPTFNLLPSHQDYLPTREPMNGSWSMIYYQELIIFCLRNAVRVGSFLNIAPHMYPRNIIPVLNYYDFYIGAQVRLPLLPPLIYSNYIFL